MDSLGKLFLTPLPCISLLPFVMRYLHAVFCLGSYIFGWLVLLITPNLVENKQKRPSLLLLTYSKQQSTSLIIMC